MQNKFKKRKENQKQIALERIAQLFAQAEKVSSKKPGLAKEYIALAKRIATRTTTKLPIELKRRFCKHCNSFFRLGSNARIRLNKGKKTYYCMECKRYTRVPYK